MVSNPVPHSHRTKLAADCGSRTKLAADCGSEQNCQEEGFLFGWDGGKEVKVSSQSHVKWSLLCPREPQLTAHLSILKIVIDTGKKK